MKLSQAINKAQLCWLLLVISLLAACSEDDIGLSDINSCIINSATPTITHPLPQTPDANKLFIPPTIPLKNEVFANKQNYPPYMGGTTINPKLTVLDNSGQFTRHVSFLTPIVTIPNNCEPHGLRVKPPLIAVDYEGEFTVPSAAVNFNLAVMASSNAKHSWFSSMIDPNGRNIAQAFFDADTRFTKTMIPITSGPTRDFYLDKDTNYDNHAAFFAPLITADNGNNKKQQVIIPGTWKFTFTQIIHQHSISHARVVFTIKNKNLPTDRLLLRPLSYENNDPQQINTHVESVNQTYKLLDINTEVLPLRNIGDKAPTITDLAEARVLMQQQLLLYPDITPEQLNFVALGLKGSISTGIAGLASLPSMQLVTMPQINNLWGFAIGNQQVANKFASPRNSDSLVIVHEMLHLLGFYHTTEFLEVNLDNPPAGIIVKDRSNAQICAQYDARYSPPYTLNTIVCIHENDGIKDTNRDLETDFNMMSGWGSCAVAKSLLNNPSYKINPANYRTLCSAAIEGNRYYDITDTQKEIIKNSMMYHSLPATNDYSIGVNDYKKYQERIDIVDDGRYHRHEPTYSGMSADNFHCIIGEHKRTHCLLPLPTTITKDFTNPEFSVRVNDKVLVPSANISPRKGRLTNGQSYINVEFLAALRRHGSTTINITLTNNGKFHSSSDYSLLVANTPDIPSFTHPSYEFDISYNSSKDNLVGITETVYHKDETLIYNLNKNYGLFKVNSTGSIILLRDIGSQDIGTYNLTLSVIESLGSQTNNTKVTINIVNFPPEFIGTPYIKRIHVPDGDELALTSNIIKVKAIDRESTDALSYTLMDGDGFRISDEGNISTQAPLPVGRYEFNVVATDRQGAKSTTEVIVIISDIQDADNDGVADLYDSAPNNSSVIINGNGTADNPYIIKNIYQLQAISGFDHHGDYLPRSKFVNYQLLFGAGQTEQLGKYYLLSNNINASETQNWNPTNSSNPSSDRSGFLPIGAPISFYGRFDGAGFTIDSLYINRPADINIGLFGETDDAIITSLNIINADITGKHNVGALVGHSRRKIITQTTASGIIKSAGSSAGGLVGLQDNGLIDSSNSTGEVHAEEYVGGLVGQQRGGLIISSHSSSKVSGELMVGGLMGAQELGAVQFSYATGNVTGYEQSGGLIGYQDNGEALASYATGIVHGQGTENASVGGLIGEQNSGSIISSYFAGNISTDSMEAIGTMVGKHRDETSEIRGSYANAKISIAGTTRNDIGLVGLLPTGTSGNIIDSYWDNGNTGTSGIGAMGTTNIGIGLRTEQLTSCGLDGNRLFLTPITISCNDNSGNIIFPSSNWGNVSMEHATGLREAGTIRYGWIFEPLMESPFLFAEDENGNSLMPSPQQQLCQRNHLHNCSFTASANQNSTTDPLTQIPSKVPGKQEVSNTGEPIFSASSIAQLLYQEPSQVPDNQTDDVLFIPQTISLTKQPFSKKQNYPPYMGGTIINPRLAVLDDSEQFTRHVSFLTPKRIKSIDSSLREVYYEGEFIIPDGAVNFNLFVFASSNAYTSWFDSMIDPNGRNITEAFIHHYTRTLQNGGPVIFGPGKDFFFDGILNRNNYAAIFSPRITADISNNKSKEVVVPGVWRFTFSQLVHKHSISHARVVFTIKNKNMPTDRLLLRPLSYENNDLQQRSKYIESIKQTYKLLNISTEILPLRNIGDKAPTNIENFDEAVELMQKMQLLYPDITPEQFSFVSLGLKGSLKSGLAGMATSPGMHLVAIPQVNNLWGLALGNNIKPNKFASPRNLDAIVMVHEMLHFLGFGHAREFISVNLAKPPEGLMVMGRSNAQICAQYNAHFLSEEPYIPNTITCIIDTDGIRDTSITLDTLNIDFNIMSHTRDCYQAKSLLNNPSYRINPDNYITLCSAATETDIYYDFTDIQKEIIKNSMMYHSLPAINNNSIGINDYKKYQRRIDAVDDGRYHRSEPIHSDIKADNFDCVIAENERTPCLLPLPTTITTDFNNPEFSISVNDNILVPPANISPRKGALINGQAYINVDFQPAPYRHGSTNITLTISNNSRFHSSSVYALLVKNSPDIPFFRQPSYEFDISYNSSKDDLVGITENVYREDEVLTYNLSEDYGLFKVNGAGSITLLRDIGLPDTGTYNLTLSVTEPISSRTTNTKISINIVNFPPEFIGAPYKKIVQVLDGANQLDPTPNLVRVKAIDKESTDTPAYTLTDANGFNITEEGNIYTEGSLPIGRYKFNVVATDSKGATSEAAVNIRVTNAIIHDDTDKDGVADIYDGAPDDPLLIVNGSGTADNPYIISNIYQLQAISGFDHHGNNLPNSKFVNYEFLFGADQIEQNGKYYLLNNNINASETKNWNPTDPNNPISSRRGFLPIGTPSSFQGQFDGAGFTIDSLYINRPTDINIGLFGETDDAIITSLNIINVDITGEHNVGALVGHSRRNIITQSTASGIIRAAGSSTGGLVGLQDDGLIDSSNSTGEVHAGEYVGGLVGRQRGGLIISSHSSSKVSGEFVIGGLMGGQEPGAVQFSYATGNVTGYEKIGGLIGYQENGEILASYSTGGIIHKQGIQKYSVGGLIGEQNSGSIISSYFTGNISADSAEEVGSMVGKHRNETSEIRGSYANAGLSIAGTTRNDIGLVGLLPTGSSRNIIDSYWDNGDTGIIGMGIGLRTEQLTGCGLDGTPLFLTPVTTSCNDDNNNIIFPSSNWGNVSMEHATGIREAGTIRYGWIFEPPMESPFLFAEDENGNSLMPSPQQQLCQRNHLHNCIFSF